MKRRLFITAGLWMALLGAAMAQTATTLEDCKRMARDNYPKVKQYRLIEASRDFTMQNAAKGWLPQVSVSAGANVFTDIIDLPQLEAAGIGMKNHLFNASVVLSQTIYDGGAIAAGKRVAQAQADVQTKQLDVTVYDLNQRIEQLYFGILMLDEQLKQNKLLQDDLGISFQTVKSMAGGGIASQSDIDAVQVEQVKARQAEGALKASRHAYLTMLGTFTGRQMAADATLATPAVPALTGSMPDARPELSYYMAQGRLLNEQRRQLDTQLAPRLSAFGMGMYHSSTTDLMKNGMLAAGITLNWNIGALYTRKNDIRKNSLQRMQIESERETFVFNNRLQNEQSAGVIDNLMQQISQDDEIIALRERIRSTGEKKVQMGTETVNEMLRYINAVSEARRQKALHEIQLLKEIYNKKTINNN
jgi:outer membrane protein TolC